MSSFLSIGPNLVLSPFPDRTTTLNPLVNRTHYLGLSNHRPFLRGSLGVARLGFKNVPIPDPDAAEGIIRDLFGRAESFLFTIADAAVSSASSDSVTSTKQSSDWLSGITSYMETVLKVLKDGLSALHVPYAYGFAIILLTVLVKAATFPLTKKQIESTMAMKSLQPQIKAIQQRYAEDQERIQLETARLYKLAGINPLAGCLPTLATIPVWIGLYRALSNVADEGLLTEGFFWIPSLAGPTTVAARQSGSGISWLFPFVDGHPPLGWSDTSAYLVLPVLLVLSQYISVQIMQSSQANNDPNLKSSQAITKFLPLMIGYFSLSVPSGLSLYCVATRGLNQKLLTFHNRPFIFSIMMSSNNTRVSAFSAGSPTYSPPKRVVGTHNGSFHCDEALGCFMIRLTNKFSAAEIVRTRDPQVLETLDAVLDVGGVYDPSRDRYDHHQKGFDQVFGHGFTTKLSSAGLVYKHYGMEIIANELQLDQGHPDVHRLFLAIYKSFMEAIDAIDNGINRYDTDQPPKYVNNTHLSSRVGRLNLDWMDPDQSPEKENEAFQQAMALAGSEFLDRVRFHAKSWLPARSIVMECLAARHDIDPSGEIMVLNRFCPWKLHLFELEEEMKIDPPIKYVLYEDERAKQWRVQAMGISPDKFECRKALPSQWRGLRDEELSKEAGIPGCVFVHMSGFIGGNQSFEGALAMARGALKL